MLLPSITNSPIGIALLLIFTLEVSVVILAFDGIRVLGGSIQWCRVVDDAVLFEIVSFLFLLLLLLITAVFVTHFLICEIINCIFREFMAVKE